MIEILEDSTPGIGWIKTSDRVPTSLDYVLALPNAKAYAPELAFYDPEGVTGPTNGTEPTPTILRLNIGLISRIGRTFDDVRISDSSAEEAARLFRFSFDI